MPADPQAIQASQGRQSRTGKAAEAYRTISEVAEELEVKPHVLRFWETKFTDLRPLKRHGGRRFYRPQDVAFLRKLKSLLYDEGYTIKGAQAYLKKNRGQLVQAEDVQEVLALRDIVNHLEDIRKTLG